MTTCSVAGCLKDGRAGFGFCSSHYWRFKRHGDPTGGPRLPYRMSDAERFTAFTQPSEGGCILWTNRLDANGYGLYTGVEPRPGDKLGRKKSMVAHRFAWFLHYGEVPNGELDHTCYNRACVNIAHLRVVNRREHITSGVARRAAERSAYRMIESAIVQFYGSMFRMQVV